MITPKRIDWPLMIFCLALIGAVAMAAVTVARSANAHRAIVAATDRVR